MCVWAAFYDENIVLQIAHQPEYSGNLIFNVPEANKGLSVGRAVMCASFLNDNSLSCKVNSRDLPAVIGSGTPCKHGIV